MTDELRAELASVVAAVRAHLEVEAELGNVGIGLRAPAAAAPEAKSEAAAAPRPPPPAAPKPGGTPPAAQGAEKLQQLAVLAEEARTCTACVLHEKRTQAVFARGNPDAELVFVGEGPGFDEDQQGLPFVGPAGQLLDRMVAAMGFERDEVYICNVVKCRPPENRTPRPEEAIACSRFLTPQLNLVAPRLIVALGRCAAENLGVARATGSWRGRAGSWNGIQVLPTYHPAYLLRSPEQKRVVWEDLQVALSLLGRTPPSRRT